MPPPRKEEAEKIESEIAPDFPDAIQAALEDLTATYDKDATFFRARIHDDRMRRSRISIADVGPPPAKNAKDFRASREGESVLYVASDEPTALAEVRAWRGMAVALAPVRPKRQLTLIDLTRARDIGSPFFDEQLGWKVQLSVLLDRLSSDMSTPVIRDEDRVLYKPTQLLAWLVRSNGYDGIVFPSAMGPGINVVLFNPDDADIGEPKYVRVKHIAFSGEVIPEGECLYEESLYGYALPGGGIESFFGGAEAQKP